MQLGDDDDLIVDLEEVEDTGLPDSVEEVEEAASSEPFAETASEDDDGLEAAEVDAPIATGKKAPAAGIETDDDDPYERIAAAENRARQSEAGAIMAQAKAHAQVAEQQANTKAVALDSLNSRIDDAYDKLTRAKEAGDTALEVQIEKALREMVGLRQQVEAQQIPDPRRILAMGEEKARGVLNAPPEGKKVGAGIQARIGIAARWAGENAWMQSNTKANQFVINQSTRMAEEGWDAKSPAFYAELSKRVKQAFPALQVKALQARKASIKAAVRTPVAPSRSASGAGTSNPNRGANAQRYTLTAADQVAMRRHNLDPANKTHRKYFAKSRLEQSRQAQR